MSGAGATLTQGPVGAPSLESRRRRRGWRSCSSAAGPGWPSCGEAAELANAGRELSVITLAPQVLAARWGRAGGEGPYNIAMREESELELQEAREILGSVASRASFQVLAGRPQPPLASWVSQHGCGLVLLPTAPLHAGRAPARQERPQGDLRGAAADRLVAGRRPAASACAELTRRLRRSF